MKPVIKVLLIVPLALFVAAEALAADSDSDGVDDAIDNCTNRPNPNQLDSDADGYGNACDGDYDNDGTSDMEDFEFLQGLLTSQGFAAVADHDENGVINARDVALFNQIYGRAPGPSGLACAGSAPCPKS